MHIVKLLYFLNGMIYIATILAPLIDGTLLSLEYLYHNDSTRKSSHTFAYPHKMLLYCGAM